MGRSRQQAVRRGRVGHVSFYPHHGGWWLYYRERGRVVRRRVADDRHTAAQLAAQVNAQLAVAAPSMFAFTPLTIAELRRRFLEYHESVVRSSLATVSRYRAATQHLENFAVTQAPSRPAHEFDAEAFVRYLRTVRVSPNGHLPRAQPASKRVSSWRFPQLVSRQDIGDLASDSVAANRIQPATKLAAAS